MRPYDECIILVDMPRTDILTELKQVSGITEAMLFPDFEKFAFLRREEEPYTVRSAHEYMELAREQLNREQLNIDEYDKAIDYYNRAIYQDSRLYRSILLERGRAKALCKKNINLAILDFDKSIDMNPDYVEAHYYRADAKFVLGDLDGAKEDIEKALPLAEESGDSKFIGYIEGLLNDLSEITPGGEQDE